MGLFDEKKERETTAPFCCGKPMDLKFVDRLTQGKEYTFQCGKCGKLMEMKS